MAGLRYQDEASRRQEIVAEAGGIGWRCLPLYTIPAPDH